jgi:hypothetical protein
MAKQPKTWVVDFDSDAVIDFEDVKSRGPRGCRKEEGRASGHVCK